MSRIHIAQVIPDLATFAVDDGFSYRIPETLSGVTVGSIVRVPLGGRRVRGYVTHIRSTSSERKLKDVLGIVGELPVFSEATLASMRWAATHYVAPMAALLSKTGPPNAPRRLQTRAMSTEAQVPGDDASRRLVEGVVGGRRMRAQYYVGEHPAMFVARIAGPLLDARKNVVVVTPTVTETTQTAARLSETLDLDPRLMGSQVKAAIRTRTWIASHLTPGQLIVGTRELAPMWLGDVGLVVVLEEGRPAMKAPQTPTIAVSSLLRRRSVAEGFQLAYIGATPTLEVLGGGVEVVTPATRPWPLVEIADRSEEPAGGGLLLDATYRAIRGVLLRQGTVFVFVTGRGDAAAFRCVRCGELRRCNACGAAVNRREACSRCGTPLGACASCAGERFQPLGAAIGTVTAELRRFLGDQVTAVGEGGPVEIGTERDLPFVTPKTLAVVVDADGMILAPHYRAEEDALRTMARVVGTVERGRGHRCLIQTLQSGHRVIHALRVADPVTVSREMLADRENDGFPPVADLLALEVTNPPSGIREDVAALAAAVDVLGPAEIGDRVRWLISANDLRPFKIGLRSVVQRWRDHGASVRIDVDPVRL